MARDLPEKLRLTAALLGCSTRKELAAEFRKANSATEFDLERAYKWLQGRSVPRNSRVYGEWLGILQLELPTAWLIDCTAVEFLDVIVTRHDVSHEELTRRANSFAGRIPATAAGPSVGHGAQAFLSGSFATYRNAFSPYYRGRVLRGSLVIGLRPADGLTACYVEGLPTGAVRAVGSVEVARGCLSLDLRCTQGEGPVFMCVVAPAPPASFMAGMLCDAALITPHPQPSASRIAFVRVNAEAARLEASNRYMETNESLGADLAALGMGSTVMETETRLSQLLRGGHGGVDHIDSSEIAPLTACFDELWLEATSLAHAPLPPVLQAPTSGPLRRNLRLGMAGRRPRLRLRLSTGARAAEYAGRDYCDT